MTLSPINPMPCLASKYILDTEQEPEFLTNEGAQPAAMKRMIDRLIEPKDTDLYSVDGSNILEYNIIEDEMEWWWIYLWNWPDMNTRGFLYTVMYFLTFGGYARYVPWARLF
jgi:hypothetical protein